MTSRRAKKAKAWSYIAGEKGKTRVRVYERQGYGIWIDTRDETGQRWRKSLGTTDREEAKARADEIAARFRREAKRQPTELTLAVLIDIYDREVTSRKADDRKRYERRTFQLFKQQFGSERLVRTLTRRDWDAYLAARQSGELRPQGVKAKRLVGNQIIRHDLMLLGMMLTWASESGDGNGGLLLERNPLQIRRGRGGHGVSLPKELSPKRPILTAKKFEEVRTAAAAECGAAEAFVVLAWRTGHRAQSIRHLRWTDVDLAGGRIRWAAEYDKVGREHFTLVHRDVVQVLKRERTLIEVTGGDLGGWVFCGVTDPTQPLGRDTLNKWFKRFAGAAGLPKGQRYGWHSFRRGFANRLHRAGTALKDLQGLGGWTTSDTLVEVYLQADEEAQRRALALDQDPE